MKQLSLSLSPDGLRGYLYAIRRSALQNPTVLAFGVLFWAFSAVVSPAATLRGDVNGPDFGLSFDSTGLIAEGNLPLPAGCNDPIVGKGTVIDEISGGTACLLCGNSDVTNLIDGDLSNYTTFNAPATLLVPTSIVSIKEANVDYAAGMRAGFVIQPIGGVLSLSVGGPFQIRTYLNNTLQQTVTGSALTTQVQGPLRRVSFVTSQPFDEVELVATGTLGVLTSVRVYYAYVEVSNCDYSCPVVAIATPTYAATIDASLTGIIPICILCTVTNTARVVDSDTTNFANISLPVGVGGGAAIAVKAGTTLPAGYEAGFAVRQGSGLLNATLLGATRIETYLAGTLRETTIANNALANVSLLGATAINLVSFKTTLSFDEVRLRVNGVSILVDMDVFYAFVRKDDDNDNFLNCADKCAGNPDYLDADGDGTPDGCDAAMCTINAGLDISTCPTGMTAQLTAAGAGQSWSALAGNPAAATVSSGGAVSGLSAEGTYGFVLTQGTCRDTVYVNRFESTLSSDCNNPITGPKVVVTNPGGNCLLCPSASIVIDGVLSNYVSLNTGTSILSSTTLLAVRDTSQVYPAGRRTGFVVQALGGLLSASLLSNFQIRTYLNGVLRETATTSGGVLTASSLAGNNGLQRISFVTTQSFNEVELVATSTLSVLTSFRVYYAFEEPGSGCPALDGETCSEALNVSSTTYCGQLSYARTGITGVVCAACLVNNLSNLVDASNTNFATIQLAVGAGAAGQVAVYSRQTIPAGYTAGFVISGPANLLDASVLGGLRVRTFLNGVQQEEKIASGGLLTAQVLDVATGKGQLSFVTTLPFNEVQLRVDGVVAGLSNVQVYYGFVRRDSDADGAPDCADKCCGGDDSQDTNGNGVPNFCDPLPIAVDDAVSTNEDTPLNINILSNDSFGDDGPGNPALQLITNPAHGTVAINNNGTPANRLDDYIVYTPTANYNGPDVFTYRICDSSNDCDTATVHITVNSVDDFPFANPDAATLNEDAAATNILVLGNDSFGGDGPAGSAITITGTPTHGTATVNNNGTPANPTDDYIVYTPAANYNGKDQIIYQICDFDGDCDTALLTVTVISVNDLPVANNNTATLNEDAGPTNLLVLANDNFGGDGPSTTPITITVAPLHGTATVNNNGTPTNPTDDFLVYTPAANYHGTDQITYRICDADGDCASAVVNLTINSVDDLPTAVDDVVTLNEDAGATTFNVISNDDFGGDGPANTAIMITGAPMHGTATVNNNGTPTNPTDDYIVYTPAANYNGTDQLTYQICDADGDCDPATVGITVNSVDDFPVANNDTRTLNEDAGPTNILVLANDNFGGDGPANTAITITGAPTHGTATVNNNGTPSNPTDDYLVYTPTANYNGTDQIVYQICDADGDCVTGTVNITVNSVDDFPVANDDAVTLLENASATNIPVLANDNFGGDGPAATAITITVAPTHGVATVNNNGTPANPTDDYLVYTPTAGYTGSDLIAYQICDADGDCIAASVVLHINGPINECNNPITGKGTVVDAIAGTCLLCGNADLANLVDGDLSNYTTFSAPATLPGATSVVSIKDVNVNYASGERVGYVMEPVGGLLSVGVQSSFQLRTFLDNVLQETVTGSALTVQNQGNLRRISFVTTQAYDEVELRIVSTLGVLTAVRVYYAFEEPAAGCDYVCINGLVPPTYSPTIDPALTGILPVCVLCSVSNTGRVVDADTTNFANINLPIGVGGGGAIAVQANTTVAAGYEVGFAVRQGNGLLNTTLLGAINIETYLAGAPRESVVASSGSTSVSLLGGTDINLLSFKTTLSFDEVRIRANGVSILVDLDVFYAFLRSDNDNDGFANCVDKCPGNPDYLDADGDGIPNGCDAATCMLNAGLDISTCPSGTTAQLVAAGVGQTWSPLAGNPAAASISSSGTVTGLSAEGIYGFVLTEGTCRDTVYVNYFEYTLDAACNNPIVGPKVIVTNPGGGNCLLCPTASVVIDGNLNGYVALNSSTTILGTTTLLAVRDTSQVYPAGRRAGFVVQSVGGILSASVLTNLQIRTYLNGVLQETATTAAGALKANALTGDGALQRLSFLTTQPFNEIELVVTGALSLLTEFRIYYAFEEPGTGCPTLDGETCAEVLNIPSTTYCGQVSYPRTGLVGVACVGCSINNIGNLVDSDASNFTAIHLTAGVGSGAQLSVHTRQTISAGYTAGFVISGPPNLLDANVLGGLRVRTFLNGVQQQEQLASGGLLTAQVLDVSTGRGQLSLVTTLPFDEVQLQVDGLVGALSDVQVYYGFVRRDSDGDGAPDCADKCCGGDDRIDTNGNGVPNFCDPLPTAVDDVATTNEDTPVNINILTNDNFGDDGPGVPAIQLVTNPAHGTASINNNGTPANPLDDYVVYTPAADYNGADVFTYRICDSSNDCDTATVNITVNPIDDFPVANDDAATLNEDAGPTNITVITNDNFGGDGPSNTAITITTPPMNGTATVNNNGTPTNPTDDYIVYTPNANYHGADQLTYQICDADGECDQALVNLTVNSVDDLPVANDDVAILNEDAGPTNIPVLANDNFGGDGGSNGPITVTVAPTHGTATVNDNGTPADPSDDYLVYTPNANYHGTDQITYQICDADGDCDLATVNITVNSVDDSPVANDDAVTLLEDIGVTPIFVLDNDNFGGDGPSSSAITITVSPLHGIAFVNNNGTLTNPTDDYIVYTPNLNYHGTDQLTYQICDADGDCDPGVVNITITPIDDFPLAINDLENLNEDAGPTNIPVLINDTFGGDGPSNTAITITAMPANGIAAVNNNGTPGNPTDDYIVYTPNANYQGSDQLTYQICDADGDCDDAVVTITVNAVNDVPIVDNEFVTTDEDVAVSGDLTDNGDSDPDGTPLTANTTPVDSPDHGTIIIDPDGSYTYTPNPNFSGTDRVIVEICDGGIPLPLSCVNDTIFLNIHPVNDPPNTMNDMVSVIEDISTTFNPLTNDVDPENDGMIISMVNPPNNGTATITSDSTIIYTPNLNFNGPDTLTFLVCDNGAPSMCSMSMVVLGVTPVNDQPVAANDVATTNEDTPVITNVLANDHDNADTNPLDSESVVLIEQPAHGTVVVHPVTGIITYTPNANFTGTDTYRYRVCDLGVPLPALCDTALVTITIHPINDAPVANNDILSTPEDTPLVFDPVVNDTDVENNINPGSLTIVSNPHHGTVTVDPTTGITTYTPNHNFAGNDTLTYAICDLGSPALCDTALVFVTVVGDPLAKLKVKVMLQGGLIGTTNGLMRDDLRAGGYLPLTEPYTSLALPRFVHVGGGGGETTTAAVLSAGVNTVNAIVDWVFVELRSAADSSVVLQTRAALVQRDGDIVEAVDGVSMLTFAGKVGQSYFISVKHRNHLGVMTAAPVMLSNDSTVVDFIHATNAQVYNRPGAINYDGAEMVTVQNRRALWAGNSNGNTKVKYQGTASDNSLALSQALAFPSNSVGAYNFNLAFGYFAGDINLDGKVKYQGPGNDVTSIFVNIVGLYSTLNTLGLYNYDLLLEQLP